MNRFVTVNELQSAIERQVSTGRSFFSLRKCSICNSPIGYRVIQGRVWFDGSCGCTSKSDLRVSSFEEMTRAINNQPEGPVRKLVATMFGVEEEALKAEQGALESWLFPRTLEPTREQHEKAKELAADPRHVENAPVTRAARMALVVQIQQALIKANNDMDDEGFNRAIKEMERLV